MPNLRVHGVERLLAHPDRSNEGAKRTGGRLAPEVRLDNLREGLTIRLVPGEQLVGFMSIVMVLTAMHLS